MKKKLFSLLLACVLVLTVVAPTVDTNEGAQTYGILDWTTGDENKLP